MLDRQDFDVAGVNAVGDDVGRSDNDEFTGSSDAAGATTSRIGA